MSDYIKEKVEEIKKQIESYHRRQNIDCFPEERIGIETEEINYISHALQEMEERTREELIRKINFKYPYSAFVNDMGDHAEVSCGIQEETYIRRPSPQEAEIINNIYALLSHKKDTGENHDTENPEVCYCHCHGCKRKSESIVTDVCKTTCPHCQKGKK